MSATNGRGWSPGRSSIPLEDFLLNQITGPHINGEKLKAATGLDDDELLELFMGRAENVTLNTLAGLFTVLGLELVSVKDPRLKERPTRKKHALRRKRTAHKTEQAKVFLRHALSKGPVEGNELKRLAKSVGISIGTLWRASIPIKIVKKNVGFQGAFYWSLPEKKRPLSPQEKKAKSYLALLEEADPF